MSRHVRPVVSVVVPARNEAGNVGPLVDRLARVLPHLAKEVIFVDDSEDGTDTVVAGMIGPDNCAITLVHRAPEERSGGLGGAVVVGMRAACAPWVCVMDADLQHPPEILEDLLARAGSGDVDIVVASRFCHDGHADDFGLVRRTLSSASTVVAQRLFDREVGGVSDPMSGFFLARRAAIDIDALQPDGFKILLEILVRNRGLVATEVPFDFDVRHSGDSKASAAEGARYVRQLWRLGAKDMSARFGRFGAVGATGLVVNTLALVVLVDVLALWLVAAAVLATQVSTLWNFLLTDRWVFPPGARKMSTLRRAGAFLAMNNAALLLRIPLLYLLVTALGVHHAIANVASLLALTLIRFGAADTYIWARAEAPVEFQYDIHGIITIASEGRLPELQRFRVDGVIPDPTIRIRLGHVASKGVGAIALDDRRTLVYYADRLGDLGFGVEIELGERIHIVASPLLRHSPHVLYTNVVEPVLRWAFVERDHALVHAACMASGAHAFLITARTDTGKTTTALKTLDNLPFSFLSDDLTLLTRDGRALTYPKPLTISRHTLSSVKTPLLSRRERAALIVQSRLHSKSGRLFGLILARTRIPAATMNAWVQRLVPPPKFQVDRLVPHVTVIPEAQIAGMAIIQRDGVEESTLVKPQEAMDILLSNCEDAYGFPPYPAIQRWLHSRNGLDLRAVERSIISDAMRGRPSYVLKSEQRNWYRMLPGVVEQTVADLPTDLDEPLACMPAPFALPA